MNRFDRIVTLVALWPVFTGMMLGAAALGRAAEPAAGAQPVGRNVRVVVWDEEQPEQKPTYDNFLGNAIADHLKKQAGFSVRSVRLDDAGQGVPDDLLDNCDVLVWWGHKRHAEIKTETAQRIVKRIVAGQLSLVALHSAHWSRPFMEAMYVRAKDDALAALPEAERKTAEFKLTVPVHAIAKRDDRLTPWSKLSTAPDGHTIIELTLPSCVFPAVRADGKPSHLTTLLPDHPIAKGVPQQWDLPQTEMYDAPFHVPKPDAQVFEERWDGGEHFPSGCVWNVGKGKVFYFRPGHETYPIYRQEIPLRIVENACRWLGAGRAGD